jgi:hypothetical protein
VVVRIVWEEEKEVGGRRKYFVGGLGGKTRRMWWKDWVGRSKKGAGGLGGKKEKVGKRGAGKKEDWDGRIVWEDGELGRGI